MFHLCPNIPARGNHRFHLPLGMGSSTDRPMPNDSTARRNVLVLVAAQAVLGAQLPMIFTIAGLAGSSLAPNKCWATLPITAMVIGSMLTATPLSMLMQRFGRRAGFLLRCRRRRHRCGHRRLRPLDRQLPDLLHRGPHLGHLHVRKRFLPLCRCRHRLRGVPTESDQLGHGGGPPVGRLRPATGETDRRCDGRAVPRRLPHRHRPEPCGVVPVPRPRHSETQAPRRGQPPWPQPGRA